MTKVRGFSGGSRKSIYGIRLQKRKRNIKKEARRYKENSRGG